MTSYRLTYFDIDGGRGEHIRIAFHAAGIAFEDNRISFQEFGDTRSGMRFTCVPVLEIDGEAVTQANAVGRYVGRMAGLYPADPLQALYCDEVLGALEDVTSHIARTMRMTGDELRVAREALAEGWLVVYLRGLAELLARGGGEYFADQQLTIADLVERVAPALVEHKARVESDSRVIAYYATRQ
jgi:glutathione S-transferase